MGFSREGWLVRPSGLRATRACSIAVSEDDVSRLGENAGLVVKRAMTPVSLGPYAAFASVQATLIPEPCDMAATKRTTSAVKSTLERQRAIQAGINQALARKEKAKKTADRKPGGSNREPRIWLPTSPRTPRIEQDMDPGPQFTTPRCAGSNKGCLRARRRANPADPSAVRVRNLGNLRDTGRPRQPGGLAPSYLFLSAPSCATSVCGAVLPAIGGWTS